MQTIEPRRILGVLVAALLAAGPGGGPRLAAGDAPPGRAKAEAKRRPPRSLIDLLAALGVDSLRRQAAGLKASLPDFEPAVPVPDGEAIYGWTRALCATDHRRPGTEECGRAGAWIAERLRSMGIAEVGQERVPITVWTAEEWSLSVDGRSVPCGPLHHSGFTVSGGVKAPMVYIGEGGLGALLGKKLKGAIAVADAAPTPALRDDDPSLFTFTADRGRGDAGGPQLAVPRNLMGGFGKAPFLDVTLQAQAAGAVGIIVVIGDSPADGVPYWPHDASLRTIPGAYVGGRPGLVVREAAKTGKTANLVLRGKAAPGWTSAVWGVLPGASREAIVVAGHHDSPYRGASSAAGVAEVLAQAWAWSRVPAARRPRTLVFVSSGGHLYDDAGARAFAEAHPEILREAAVLLAIDHLPAREAEGGPAGRPVLTGRPQASTIHTCRDPRIVAAVWKAIDRRPADDVACAPGLPDLPISEAAGYWRWSVKAGSASRRKGGLPFVAWVGAPPYLLGPADTLDKVDRERLGAVAETIAEMIKNFMAMP